MEQLASDARHSLGVRISHWTTFLAICALAVSGAAILIAHPRLYWGETGGLGADSLLDLPLPFVITGQTGWGRSLHFLSAWVLVLTGLVYVFSGLRRRHFTLGMAPYEVPQRRTYLVVIFGLTPAIIWTGLAMSPAMASVYPFLVDVLGGQQSARTLHFGAAVLLLAFLIIHVIMVIRAGRKRLMEMIVARAS